jgi:hypothetical protein
MESAVIRAQVVAAEREGAATANDSLRSGYASARWPKTFLLSGDCDYVGRRRAGELCCHAQPEGVGTHGQCAVGDWAFVGTMDGSVWCGWTGYQQSWQ